MTSPIIILSIKGSECVECDVWKDVNPFLVSEVINLFKWHLTVQE